MNVLHVTNAYPYVGNHVAGIFVKEQIRSIDKFLDKNDIFFINAKKYGKFQYLKSIFYLMSNISKYDVVHAHHIYVGFIVLIISNKKSNNVLVSLMSDPDRKTGNYIENIIYKFTYNYCKKYARALIFKKEIPLNINRDNVFYLPNGVNMDMFLDMPKDKAKKILNLDMEKRYILFVSAMNLYRKEKRYDKYRAVLEVLKDRYHLDDVAELTMVDVEREKAYLYYNAAELHLLVSDIEGSPNSVKEAMSCNTPVVATDVGNIAAMLGSLDSCEVVPSFDVNVIADAVYRRLGGTGGDSRKRLEALKLDQQSVAKNLYEIYMSL